MTIQLRLIPVTLCVGILFSLPSFAQTTERRQAVLPPPTQEATPGLPANANSIDVVANEIGLLRKSLQTLNARLREISEKVLAPGSSSGGAPNDKQNSIAVNLDILSRAEQRAEGLRRQLLEWVEKETSLRSRMVQMEEDMRPESIERTMTLVGSTRTMELRETRRRVLENERKGLESLFSQITQIRQRVEDDVRQADQLVAKIRLRLLPVIDKEIDKLNPN